VGSFSTSAASYGEVYVTSSKQLSSNDLLGAYSGSNVYLSFALTSSKGTYDQNGGYPNDWGWGAGDDATTNASIANTPGGSGGQGSLLLFGSGATTADFHLSSSNFDNLTLTFNVAASQLNASRFNGTTNYTNATFTLEYSTDGGATLHLLPGESNVAIAGNTFTLDTVQLPSSLSNLPSFDLYFMPNMNSYSGGVELDNFVLSGMSEVAVPEPSAWSLMLLGVCALAFRTFVRRKPSATA